MPQPRKRKSGRVIRLNPHEKQVGSDEATTSSDDVLHNMAEGMREWVASFQKDNAGQDDETGDKAKPDQQNLA